MISSNLIKGIALGGLVGVGMGILFAPKSGKETREQILHSTQDILEKANAQYEEMVRQLEMLKSQNKEILASKTDRLKKALDAGVEAYKKETPAKPESECMTGLYGDNSLL